MRHVTLKKLFLGAGCALLVVPAFVFAINDHVQDVPAMGWNSWNYYGCNINQTTILAAANAMHRKSTVANWEGKLISMQDVGYKFVNLDDCWEGARTGGILQFSATLFPQGFVWMCDSIRRMGLVPGLYTSAGQTTCAGRPAQYGYDLADSRQFATWGFQYLKEDWCGAKGGCDAQACCITLYTQAYNALRTAAQEAFNNNRYPGATAPKWFTFSLCNWGAYSSWTFGARCGHSARMSGDISGSWASVIGIVNLVISNQTWNYNEPGFFNDPDMLEVGNGTLTTDQNKAHYDLWCQMQSPLLTGNNLASMNQTVFDIITNREVIAINQDSLNWGGRRVRAVTSNLDIWYKRCFTRDPISHAVISDQTRMKKSVIILNKAATSTTYSLLRSDPIELNAAEAYQVRNLWTHAVIDTLNTVETGVPLVTIPATGSVHLLLTPMSVIVPVIRDDEIKKQSNTQIASLIKGRRSSDGGIQIFLPMSGSVTLFDVQGREIASFAAPNSGQWYQVTGSAVIPGTFVVKASGQGCVLTKTLVLAK